MQAIPIEALNADSQPLNNFKWIFTAFSLSLSCRADVSHLIHPQPLHVNPTGA
jgi:hypothetical protein